MDDFRSKLLKLVSVFDPAVDARVELLPLVPRDDQRCRPLSATTTAVLKAPESGNGIIVVYYGAPFVKVMEHYIDDGLGYLILQDIVNSSVDVAQNYTHGRVVKKVIEIKSGYASTVGDVTSSNTKGNINGSFVPSGISQLYRIGETSANTLNYSRISQLFQDDDVKLLSSDATQGISFIAPQSLEQGFVRLGDTLDGNDNRARNLDFSEPDTIPFDGVFDQVESETLTLNTGVLFSQTLESFAVDIPWYADLSGTLSWTISNLNGIESTARPVNFNISAALYDVGRGTNPFDTITLVRGTINSTGPKNLEFTGSKIWPTADNWSHPTITAVKLTISIVSTSLNQVTLTSSFCQFQSKVTIPLHKRPGFVKDLAIIGYQGFPESAPLNVSIKTHMEVVPNAAQAAISECRYRKVSNKMAQAMSDMVELYRKTGMKYWYKTTANIDPEGKYEYSKRVHAMCQAVLLKYYYDQSLANSLMLAHGGEEQKDSYNFANAGSQDQFAGNFGKWFKKNLVPSLSTLGQAAVGAVLAPLTYKGVKYLDDNYGREAEHRKLFKESSEESRRKDKAYQEQLERERKSIRDIDAGYKKPAGIYSGENAFSSGASFSSGATFATKPSYFCDFVLDIEECHLAPLLVEEVWRERYKIAFEQENEIAWFSSGEEDYYLIGNQNKDEKFSKPLKDDKTKSRLYYPLDDSMVGIFVPAVHATCTVDHTGGNMYFLTPMTDDLRMILPASVGDSRLGSYALRGHHGSNFPVSVQSDWGIFMVVEGEGKDKGKKFLVKGPEGMGDSISLATKLIGSLKKQVKMAVTGVTQNNRIFVLDPLTAIIKKKVCEKFQIPLVGNCWNADIRVDSVDEIRRGIAIMSKLRLGCSHFNPRGGKQKRGGSRKNTTDRGEWKAKKSEIEREQKGKRQQTINNNRQSLYNVKNTKPDSPADMMKLVFMTAQSKMMPTGRFAPVSGRLWKFNNVFMSHEDVKRTYNVYFEQALLANRDFVASLYSNNEPISVLSMLVTSYLHFLTIADLFVHSGAAFKKGKVDQSIYDEIFARIGNTTILKSPENEEKIVSLGGWCKSVGESNR